MITRWFYRALALSFAIYLITLGGWRGIIAGLFYAVIAYLIVRAAPAVRTDLHRLRDLMPVSRVRGHHL